MANVLTTRPHAPRLVASLRAVLRSAAPRLASSLRYGPCLAAPRRASPRRFVTGRAQPRRAPQGRRGAQLRGAEAHSSGAQRHTAQGCIAQRRATEGCIAQGHTAQGARCAENNFRFLKGCYQYCGSPRAVEPSPIQHRSFLNTTVRRQSDYRDCFSVPGSSMLRRLRCTVGKQRATACMWACETVGGSRA